MTTLVIAEIGGAHEGRWGTMLALMDAARYAGADVVKTQWVSDPARLAARRRVADPGVYHRLAFPATWHAQLAHAATTCGLEYACTVYLPEDIPVVAPHVRRFKVSSFEARDVAFIAAHWSYGKPLIISTGMMTDTEMVVLGCSLGGRTVDLLHCVSAYPAPIDQMDLRTGMTFCDGLSDHTRHLLTGAVAVGAGATIIEAHLRLDDTSPTNPDYPHSFTPGEFKQYVANIRVAERMMGPRRAEGKVIQACEAGNRVHQVGSLDE